MNVKLYPKRYWQLHRENDDGKEHKISKVKQSLGYGEVREETSSQ